MRNAAVLWTGGKDSYLSLLDVRERMSVTRLVTFAPDPPRPFLAHPLETMAAQASALRIEHEVARLRGPVAEAYEKAIDDLAERGIEVLVTGDMDRVAGHDSWIEERARDRVEVERPLWGADRIGVLRRLIAKHVDVVCTLSRKDAFDEPIVGRRFDAALVDELAQRHGRDGFDACGENGEYHTCVVGGPGFAEPLRFTGVRVAETDEFHHIAFDGVERGGG
ncbi:MAG: hypothetical protein AAF726_05600 [Planctomycetota bacterium]